MMKILFVTHKFPPFVGGMETQCYELYKGVSASAETILMKMPDNANRLLWLLTLGRRIRKALRKDPSITHVYFNDGLTGLAGAGAVKKVSQAKTVVTLHGLDVVFPGQFYQKRLIRNLTENVDAAIAVSSATADECRKRGIPSDRVFTVPNGVDLSLADIPRDPAFIAVLEERLGISLTGKKILVSIGRSVLRKGFSWFLQNVMPRLDDDIVYLIIGPRQEDIGRIKFMLSLLPSNLARQISLMGVGMDKYEIDKGLAMDGVRGRAFHLGKLPFKELVQTLKNSYAFVMPNIKIDGDAEGFGLVALEAVMCGAVPIVAGMEGITEAIVDGENGIHVRTGDVEDWVSRIHQLCADPVGRDRLAAASLEYSRNNFSWDKMNNSYLDIFRTIAQ